MKTRALAYECLCTNTIYVQEQAKVIHTRHLLGVHTSSEQIRAKHKTGQRAGLTLTLSVCAFTVSASAKCQIQLLQTNRLTKTEQQGNIKNKQCIDHSIEAFTLLSISPKQTNKKRLCMLQFGSTDVTVKN